MQRGPRDVSKSPNGTIFNNAGRQSGFCCQSPPGRRGTGISWQPGGLPLHAHLQTTTLTARHTTMRTIPLLIQTILLLSTISFAYQSTPTCFLPNGTADQGNDGVELFNFEPCSNTTGYSMCCRQSSPGETGEICRPDGLCSDDSGEIWRNGCTDQTWQDPACVKLCTSGTGKEDRSCCLVFQ